MFADDQTLCVSGNDIDEVDRRINENIMPISSWVSDNVMAVNITKTKSMVVASGPKIRNLTHAGADIHVKINDINICNVSSHNLLGIEIDSTLSWDVHIHNLCKKLSSRIAILRKFRPFTTTSTLLLVYNAIFLSVIDYCCTVWGNTSKSNLQRIYKLQKGLVELF